MLEHFFQLWIGMTLSPTSSLAFLQWNLAEFFWQFEFLNCFCWLHSSTMNWKKLNISKLIMLCLRPNGAVGGSSRAVQSVALILEDNLPPGITITTSPSFTWMYWRHKPWGCTVRPPTRLQLSVDSASSCCTWVTQNKWSNIVENTCIPS